MKKQVKIVTVQQLADGVSCHKNSIFLWLCRPEFEKHCKRDTSKKLAPIAYIHLTKDFIKNFMKFLGTRPKGYIFQENFQKFLGK